MTKVTKLALISLVLICSLKAFGAQMDKVEFQKYVHSYLKENYKGRDVEILKDPEVLSYGEAELGLQNIYNSYLQSKEDEKKDFEAYLKEHFDRIFKQLDANKEMESITWDKAKGAIRLQFAPSNYRINIPIVFKELDENVLTAYVIDDESGYRFVIQSDLDRWKIGKEALEAAALENVINNKNEIPMHVVDEKDKFIIVQVLDGYDAARILNPDFRKFISGKLGSPFNAAIPNRDFLIMWSTKNSEEFLGFVKRRINEDFETQPYPLSNNIFQVDERSLSINQ